MIDDDKQMVIIDATPRALQTDVYPRNAALELVIGMWLDAKGKRSGSERTKDTYKGFLASFRGFLQQQGYDLDADQQVIATAAQAWCGLSVKGKKLAAATFNQRRSVLSSFYAFARKRGFLGSNPIEMIDGLSTQEYRSAHPLDADEVGKALTSIPRETMAGARDYTLLSLALTTGRRVNELVSLRIKHLEPSGDSLTITWERTKGGKTTRDRIHPHIAQALVRYLETFYAAPLTSISPDAPVWVSLDNRNKGKELHHDGVALICKRWLGTSKAHALRHTFARTMSDAGAKPEEIQAKLQHTSLQTTSRYLATLSSAENKHIDKMAALLGIKQ